MEPPIHAAWLSPVDTEQVTQFGLHGMEEPHHIGRRHLEVLNGWHC